MSAAQLAALPRRRSLTEGYRHRLASVRQQALPDEPLLDLPDWMLDHGEKGEQEAMS